MKYSKTRKYRDKLIVVEEVKVTKIKNESNDILKNIMGFFKKNK
jgi:hypothetical protein